MLPLAVVGWLVFQARQSILHDQRFAQVVIGLAACAATPLLGVLVLETIGEEPLLGWGSLWQWLVMALAGGLLTPVCFTVLNALQHAVSYPVKQEPAFRSDRQIKRGRNPAC